MEQSPNFEEPLKPNKIRRPSSSTSKTASTGNGKKPLPAKKPEDPKTGEPVLGSDKGPWKGTD